MTLHGVGASAGIGIGTAVCVREQNLDYTSVPFSGAEQEKARLRAAADLFTQRTQAMADDITKRVGEAEAAILTGQIMMLEDPFMLSQMEEAIDAGKCAEEALDTVCQTFIAMFSGVEDELMRQRAADIGDIRTRMLGILLHAESVDLSSLPEGSVLVAHDLTPSMTVSLSKEHVCAILTEVGGQTSHSAILARALEVPAVLGVPGLLDAVKDGMTVAVDGTEGAALLGPDETSLAAFQARRDKWLEERSLLQIYRDRDTRTADGRHVDLYANIGSVADARAAAEVGAEGVGLFRTEFLSATVWTAPTSTRCSCGPCSGPAHNTGTSRSCSPWSPGWRRSGAPGRSWRSARPSSPPRDWRLIPTFPWASWWRRPRPR